MQAMDESTVSEYRVIPVTRFMVTRYRSSDNCAGSDCLGEFNNEDAAGEVAYALAYDEARMRRLPPGDGRIVYPTNHNKPATKSIKTAA